MGTITRSIVQSKIFKLITSEIFWHFSSPPLGYATGSVFNWQPGLRTENLV